MDVPEAADTVLTSRRGTCPLCLVPPVSLGARCLRPRV